MRVIAGTYGGRRLQAPPGTDTRPTGDRVREALFSILGERSRDARVLDLFAGSGALGIEALSRGAMEATFVDKPAAAKAVLAPGATVVSESDRRAPLEMIDLPIEDERRYGDTLIRIHGS